MRHRRDAHGLGGRRHGAARDAPGRAFVRVLPVDARQRAHLQQRDREETHHLHGDARGPGAGRSWAFAPVGAGHLGHRRGSRPRRVRAVQREGSAAGDSLGGRAEPRKHVSPLCERAARSAVFNAGRLRAASRKRRHAQKRHRRRDRRLRHDPADQCMEGRR